MAEAAGVGFESDLDDTATLFGEDQGRYLVACNFDTAEYLMAEAAKAGVPIRSVGAFKGDKLRFGGSEAALSDLSAAYRAAFAETFG